MPAREDCRHYIMQSVRGGERTERCRLDVAALLPFSCPADCLFFERRSTSSTGWHVGRPEGS
ncbi:MAG: hypothetical protein M0014_08560 [Actinomycetota bacterium]|nr:hypothetical protein [Actinomycetota bacterium]